MKTNLVYFYVRRPKPAGPKSGPERWDGGASRALEDEKGVKYVSRLTSHVSALPGRDGIPREGL
jgi:hypothetical protein